MTSQQDKDFWRELLIKKATENKQYDLVQHLYSDKVWDAAWGHLIVIDNAQMTLRKSKEDLDHASDEAGVTILVIAQIVSLLIQVWFALKREKWNKKGQKHDILDKVVL